MKIRKQLTPDSWRTTKKHDKKVWAIVRRCSFDKPMTLEEAIEMSGKWESQSVKYSDEFIARVKRAIAAPGETMLIDDLRAELAQLKRES